MALPHNATVDEYNVTAHLEDITTGTPTAFAYVPIRGEIVNLKACPFATVAGSSTVITPKVNTTTITGGTLTILVAGAAGDVYNADIVPGSTTSNHVNEGDVIRFVSDGGSNNATVPTTFQATIRSQRRI